MVDAVPAHGHPVRVADSVLSLLPKASGAPSETWDVIAGAVLVAVGLVLDEPGVPLPSLLIWPPVETIDSHVPLVPEYEYWEPVE